ncbi:MAG: SUMF1/EgtB/PvdO family nonheme iron enzyme [Thermoguttaceae bacterium]|nr:SUMF1/EgtB/PvdO family nonheme iron enzyme [Thermoguttaceae bacterium]
MSASEESSNNTDFNPYRVWLGIPANKLPADHYSLLGLETYESDPDVIESAADKVMAFVKTFQNGKYSKQSQQLLNEIAAARVCLLNEKAKAEYDAKLRAKEQQAPPSQLGMVAPPPIIGGVSAPPVQATAFNFGSADKNRSGHEKSKDRKKGGGAYVKKGSKTTAAPIPFWIWGAGAAALTALALIAFMALSGNKPASDTEISQNDSDLSDDSSVFDEIISRNPANDANASAKNDKKTDDKKSKDNAANSANTANTSASAQNNQTGNKAAQNDNATVAKADGSQPSADSNIEYDPNAFSLQEATADSVNDLEPVYKTEEEREAALKAAAAKANKTGSGSASTVKTPVKRTTHTVTGLPFPSANKAGDRHVITIDDAEYAFRWIPPGTFTMGSPSSEPGRNANEIAHSETISAGFWMLETEVTHAMCDELMDLPKPSATLVNRPVSSVSWDKSRNFCDKLSRITGQNFTLPTEVQWEYACRAGATSAYNFGADSASLCKNGNYSDQSHVEVASPTPETTKDAAHNDGFERTAPVKSFPPNAWGLYDMHGNVFEWCLYPCNQPLEETPNSAKHVRRGGGFHSSLATCRSAARSSLSYADDQSGFRVVYRGDALPKPPEKVARKVEFDKTRIDGDIRKPGRTPGQRAEVKVGDVSFIFRWCPPGSTIVYRSSTKDVAISQGFWMLETEVTQQMYKKITGKNPSQFVGKYNPVEQVSWTDAQLFCQQLSQKLPPQMGKVEFFLPTEAQWVYAGRAGKLQKYTTGDSLSVKDANCHAEMPCPGEVKGKYIASTLPTGTYSPNAWGLYDMHGNVGEWCFDRYDAQYRAKRSSNLFFDPVGAPVGTNRIVRGGSWFSPYESSRFLTGFYSIAPESATLKIGFRICTFPMGASYNNTEQVDGDLSGLFVNQPQAVDLPEKTSEQFVTLLTLPPTDYPWELSALGLAQFKQGDTTLAFIQTNNSVDNAEWKYQIKSKDGDLDIAQLKREGNSLMFRFTDITGYEIVQMIRNTILKIKIGADSHHLALRKPHLITDIKFDCFIGKKTYSPNLKYLPKGNLVFYDIASLDHSPQPSFTTSFGEPVNKPGRIAFMMENKSVANIQFDFDLNAGLKTDIVLNSDKTFLTHLVMYTNNLSKANAAATEATSRRAEIKRKLPTERNAKMRTIMMQDSVKAQYLIWAHEFAKNAATAPPLLHFEVYVDCDGRRLPLMVIDPKLDDVPPAN